MIKKVTRFLLLALGFALLTVPTYAQGNDRIARFVELVDSQPNLFNDGKMARILVFNESRSLASQPGVTIVLYGCPERVEEVFATYFEGMESRHTMISSFSTFGRVWVVSASEASGVVPTYGPSWTVTDLGGEVHYSSYSAANCKGRRRPPVGLPSQDDSSDDEWAGLEEILSDPQRLQEWVDAGVPDPELPPLPEPERVPAGSGGSGSGGTQIPALLTNIWFYVVLLLFLAAGVGLTRRTA